MQPRIESRVVLPEPDGPSSATISPRATERETPLRTGTTSRPSRNSLATSSAWRTGVMTRLRGERRPPGDAEEEDLHRDSQPEGSDGLSVQRELAPGRAHVGGEHRRHQQHQAETRQPPGLRDLDPGGGEELEDPRCRDEGFRRGEGPRNHRDQVPAHPGEVGGGGQNEHGGEPPPRGIQPAREGFDAQGPQRPEEKGRPEQNGDDEHGDLRQPRNTRAGSMDATLRNEIMAAARHTRPSRRTRSRRTPAG